MQPNSSPKPTEDAGPSPQSHTSLRFASIERPVTPPASLAKEKDSTPDDTGTEEAREPVPDEAAVSPVDNSRVSSPTNSSARQPRTRLRRPLPGPRPQWPLPNNPIRRRGPRPRNSQIRRRGASLKQRNGHSSNERQNTSVSRQILPHPDIINPVSQRPGDLSRQTEPLIVKEPALFLVYPIHSITSLDGQNPDTMPQLFPFHSIDVPTPPTVRGGPKGALQLIVRNSPYEPEFMPDWRVNTFWKDNVERVLGRETRDNWPNMMALIQEAEASFLEKGIPLILRPWNLAEIEIAARLKAWRMPDFVVGYLIGTPPPYLGIINAEQFGLWNLDEMNRIDEVHGGRGERSEDRQGRGGGRGKEEGEEEEVGEKMEADEEK
ncbi:Ff.00g043770.m01.CDS01 [Fusarium sp. VM40]|nr:Ff.00g043770.m01.CDS01 [Fusarium sp. VM40]